MVYFSSTTEGFMVYFSSLNAVFKRNHVYSKSHGRTDRLENTR